MDRQFLKDSLGWGFILWLIGYALGIMLFAFVPIYMIGWIIMPIGAAVTYWVVNKKVKVKSFRYYLFVAVVWVLIDVIFDYLFIVKMLSPEDGYYKFDVYLYYLLTLAIPLLAGWRVKYTRPQVN